MVIKPRREEIFAMAGGNDRLTRAIEALFEEVSTLNSQVSSISDAVGGLSTGWANYSDTAGAQTLTAGVSAPYTVDALSKYDLEKPADVDTFWDAANSKITGREGDAIVVKVQCDFTPADATASTLDFVVDIGGAVGVVEQQDFPMTKGAGVLQHVSWTFLAYTLSTWEANGGTVSVVSDGPGDLTNKRIVIARAHKA